MLKSMLLCLALAVEPGEWYKEYRVSLYLPGGGVRQWHLDYPPEGKEPLEFVDRQGRPVVVSGTWTIEEVWARWKER